MHFDSPDNLKSFLRSSGATLCDLAAMYGTSPEAVSQKLLGMGVSLPSMSMDGPFDYLKGLRRGVGPNSQSGDSLLQSFTGPAQLLPVAGTTPAQMYEAAHGPGFKDPYSGEELGPEDLHRVDEDPENFLITNLEAISDTTWSQRFAHAVGPCTENFQFLLKGFEVELTVSRKYDQLVGGTYNPEFINQLFTTWVAYPLNLYWERLVEDEPVFQHRSPTQVAWWAWAQLTHYGHLKGLKSLTVTPLKQFNSEKFSLDPKQSRSPSTMFHGATLSDRALLSSLRLAALLDFHEPTDQTP